MSNCTNEFPTTSQLFEDLKEDTVIIVLTALAGVLTLVTLIIFIEEAYFVLKHYSHKTQKTKVLALLSLYPVVSSSCLIGLLVPRSMMLTELLSAIYLSFCILIFVNMVIEYFGGEAMLLQEMSSQPLTFMTPPCCCCFVCIRKVEFSQRNFRIAKSFALQVAFVRPIFLFMRTVMWSDGEYQLGESLNGEKFVFYIQLISGISTLFGMYGLIVIYRNTSERLQQYRLRTKFLALQLAFVLMNLQSFIFLILAQNDIPECKGVRGSIVRGYRTHYFLLVLEILLLAILARFGYHRQEEPMKPDKNDVEINKKYSVNLHEQNSGDISTADDTTNCT